MNQASITQHISETFAGVQCTTAGDDVFFIFDPARNLPANYQIPFATIVNSDAYDQDQVSNLNRPGVFRLNIGVEKGTFGSLFPSGHDTAGHDMTALDRLLPHPAYGNMGWVCVLNPSDEMFERLKPMLAEAYGAVVKRARSA